MSSTKETTKRLRLSTEEWFVLFIGFVREVFPNLARPKAAIMISLGKAFPKPPRSRRRRSDYQVLVKLNYAISNKLSKLRTGNRRIPLEITAKERNRIEEILRALMADPACEERTRFVIIKMRKRLRF